MRKRASFVFVLLTILVVAAVLLIDGCKYDYTSPLPGLINIRLRAKSNNLEFSPVNNFVLKVTSVEAVRKDGIRATILEDTKAIGRTTNTYNTLDGRARDSSIVMGEAYMAPGEYIGVNLLIQPGESVVLDGYRIIPVSLPESFDALLAFRQPFIVEEGKKTSIVVTIDLDNALLKGANNFYFSTLTEFVLASEAFDTVSSITDTIMGKLPVGWVRSIESDNPASGAWGIRNDASSQGYRGASSANNCFTSYSQGSGSYVRSPQVGIAGMDFVVLTFGVRFSDGDSNHTRLTTEYSPDGSTYTQIPGGSIQTPGNADWSLKTFQLPQTNSPSAFVRWTATGDGGQSDLRIDDVKVVGLRYSYYISSIQYPSN